MRKYNDDNNNTNVHNDIVKQSASSFIHYKTQNVRSDEKSMENCLIEK